MRSFDAMMREFGRRLPVLPATARLLAFNRPAHPGGDADSIERLAQIDPTLALRILLLAKPKISEDTEAPVDIGYALSRVGTDAVLRDLAASSMGRRGFVTDAGDERLWLHSAQVAMLMSRLATRFPDLGIPPAEAHLCGLLHDAARFVLLLLARDEFHAVDRTAWETARELRAAERRLYSVDHAALGAVAARDWGLPARIGAAIALHHAPRAEIAAIEPHDHRRLVRLTKLADAASFALLVSPDLALMDRHSQQVALAQQDVEKCLVDLGLSLRDLLPPLRRVAVESVAAVERLFGPEPAPAAAMARPLARASGI